MSLCDRAQSYVQRLVSDTIHLTRLHFGDASECVLLLQKRRSIHERKANTGKYRQYRRSVATSFNQIIAAISFVTYLRNSGDESSCIIHVIQIENVTTGFCKLSCFQLARPLDRAEPLQKLEVKVRDKATAHLFHRFTPFFYCTCRNKIT